MKQRKSLLINQETTQMLVHPFLTDFNIIIIIIIIAWVEATIHLTLPLRFSFIFPLDLDQLFSFPRQQLHHVKVIVMQLLLLNEIKLKWWIVCINPAHWLQIWGDEKKNAINSHWWVYIHLLVIEIKHEP